MAKCTPSLSQELGVVGAFSKQREPEGQLQDRGTAYRELTTLVRFTRTAVTFL